MHWRTFDRLRSQINAHEHVAEAYFIEATMRLFGNRL